MTENFRYTFETPRVTGRRQEKARCPQCGKKSLVRYIDTFNSNCYVADEVGKCDHENSCGYHYRPSEYYRDHAWMQQGKSNSKLSTPNSQLKRSVPPPPPLQPLSMDYVATCHSPRSTFWQWFEETCAAKLKLAPERIQQVYEDYRIGCTDGRDVIFWQIDRHFRLRTGKIMSYGTDGHRTGIPKWFHSNLIRVKLLNPEWPLYQCLFGEHLLASYPDKEVCLVESEKTACTMAAISPKQLWLATGGSCGLTPEKVECLRGRRVTIFPDSGSYQKWQKVMGSTQGLSYNFSKRLEQYPANTDLADVLLEEVKPPP